MTCFTNPRFHSTQAKLYRLLFELKSPNFSEKPLHGDGYWFWVISLFRQIFLKTVTPKTKKFWRQLGNFWKSCMNIQRISMVVLFSSCSLPVKNISKSPMCLLSVSSELKVCMNNLMILCQYCLFRRISFSSSKKSIKKWFTDTEILVTGRHFWNLQAHFIYIISYKMRKLYT